ncbi:hypothetical protein MOSE0_L00804 [Monosporozyma servazzii]
MVKLHSLCFLAKVAWVCRFCVRADFVHGDFPSFASRQNFGAASTVFCSRGRPAGLRCGVSFTLCSFALLRGGGGSRAGQRAPCSWEKDCLLRLPFRIGKWRATKIRGTVADGGSVHRAM